MPEYTFSGWDKGLNNRAKPSELERSELIKAENVDLLPGGSPRKRQGYTQVLSGSNFSCLVSTPYFAAFRRDGKFCTTRTFVDVAEHFPVEDFSHVQLNDELIISDGKVTARVLSDITILPLGQPNPPNQPTLSTEPSGGLYEGYYLVAITFVGKQGQESGTGEAARIFVPEGGGITLSGIPTHPDARQVRVYMSDVNGENLYMRSVIPIGQSVYELGYKRARKRLETQFMAPLPPGRYLCVHKARLYTAVGSVLIFSEPFSLGMYNTLKGYIPFPSEISGLAAVDGGIYVCERENDNISFLSGASPDKFTRTTVSEIGIQPGTLSTVDGGFFTSQLKGMEVAVWWSKNGEFMLGTPTGEVRPVKDTDVSIPEYELGFISEVTRQGVKQLVSVMKNPEAQSTSAIQDELTVEVHRNGITL